MPLVLDLFIPAVLSLFVGPGVGQLYNREYKKGSYLIALSLVVFLGLVVWCYKASSPYLPSDLTTIDPSALQEMMKNAAAEISKTHGHTLLVYELLLVGLWIFGVVDAVVVANRRRVRRLASKQGI